MHCEEGAVIWSDCQAAVKLWRRCLRPGAKRYAGALQEVLPLFQAVRRRLPDVQVQWIPSHLSQEEFVGKGLPQHAWAGNNAADEAAKERAGICVWWSRERLFAVRAFKLPAVAGFRVFAVRSAVACSLCAACQPFCETVFGGGVWPAALARCKALLDGVGGAKPFSAAARVAVQGAVGPRLQARCRLALSG